MTEEQIYKLANEYVTETKNNDCTIEAYVVGYIQAMTDSTLSFDKLEKENAELKLKLVEKGQHLDLTEREWGKDLVKMYHFKNLYTKQTEQLTKAKEIIKTCIAIMTLYKKTSHLETLEKAEAFLKETE